MFVMQDRNSCRHRLNTLLKILLFDLNTQAHNHNRSANATGSSDCVPQSLSVPHHLLLHGISLLHCHGNTCERTHARTYSHARSALSEVGQEYSHIKQNKGSASSQIKTPDLVFSQLRTPDLCAHKYRKIFTTVNTTAQQQCKQFVNKNLLSAQGPFSERQHLFMLSHCAKNKNKQITHHYKDFLKTV